MLLTTLEQTKQVSKGQLKWIDDMILARENLIKSYFILLSATKEQLETDDDNADNSYELQHALSNFCELLIDYLTRGHFLVYPNILTIMEHVSSKRLIIARRLIPRVNATTEPLLEFNDKYADLINLNDEIIKNLLNNLGKVGEILEIRFKHEDRMVIALQILNDVLEKSANTTSKNHLKLSEKRKNNRIPCHAEASFAMDEGEIIPCTVLDLSLKGVLLSVNKEIKPNKEGILTFKLPFENKQEQLKCRIKIVWANKNNAGASCTGIDIDSLTILRSFLKKECGSSYNKLLERKLKTLSTD